MNEAKWMEFVRLNWSALGYWEMMKAFRSKEFQGTFFYLSALSCRHSLLWEIAKFVNLCQMTRLKDMDLGDDASKTLVTLVKVHDKGKKKDNSDLDYENCGVGEFRDKELGHPLNAAKRVLGKAPYKICFASVESGRTLRLG